MWIYPNCGAEVESTLDVCWRCGTSRDGVVDPDFVPADKAGPIEDPPVVPRLDPAEVVDQFGESPEDEVVECYQALSLMEAQFIANELTAQGIPAVSDTHDLQDELGPWEGNPRVFCRAGDVTRARTWLAAYERRKAEHDRSE
ncbi:hypothetical protein V5E97_35680 [Singulisphaera sp. Ch08]|uniref:DUF2007 domain-containing protein n=1 Tax=Singulisphaera sp. Ch08 TaxID=3120278 RepID=A0AAU7CDR9_9BACT